ncbi:ester cyclase [Dyadobacter sp. CY326]|uniref:ester cyclase n=1 Tax=Dyadobacter sp. CY326 TaxID=2907300 RepID=UPI001F1F0861|nr:ester cyclase [Dyadobacter sp. CY326]MCE7066975.1 ester cyclase [Dyadobacter sp. CY326]
MTFTPENKQIARLWLQLVSEGKVEAICALTAPTWKMHGGAPNMPEGPDGVRYLFNTFDHIDQQWTVNMIFAEGDYVTVRATNSCMQSSFLGIPAAGKRQVFTSTFIFHIVDGMMMETWRNADDLGRVLQLGAKLVPSEA